MSEKQEDRLIHVACDVPPQVFGPLLLLLHDCRVENLQTIIPERGTARVHHKQALALPKPRQRVDGKPWGERLAQRQEVRQRLLAAFSEHSDGITAHDMLAKHFPDYKHTLAVSVPMDRMFREGVLVRSNERPYSYRLKQPAASKPARTSAGLLKEQVTAIIRQHTAGLSVAQMRKILGGQYGSKTVGNALAYLCEKGTCRRVGDKKNGFVYLPRTAQ